MNVTENITGKITRLEEEAKSLDPDRKERKELTDKTIDYADDFLESLPLRPAYSTENYNDEAWKEVFAVREDATPIEEILSTIDQFVDRGGLNPASAGHLGYIPGGGLYGAALGDYLAAVSNRYAGVFFASPGAVRIENTLINWAGRLIGYNSRFGGNLTSGGSIANLIAIATARTAMGVKARDFERSVIYLSGQAHHSVQKAIRIAGMGECILRYIPVDGRFRMQADLLEQQLENDRKEDLNPIMVIANAGSTDTGAVDPLEKLAEITVREKIWFHVDGAYGGFFLLTEDGKMKLKGIEHADSVVLDPHKGLFLPYGLGMVLVKDVEHLLKANDFEANYMQDTLAYSFEMSPAEVSPELSKHFRGLRLWMPLMLHGVKPFRAGLEEKLLLARYFYQRIRALGFETGPYPDLSVVVFRKVIVNGNADEYNALLLKKIQEEGSIFISSTRLNGNFMLRFAILSFRSHLAEVDRLLALLERFDRENG